MVATMSTGLPSGISRKESTGRSSPELRSSRASGARHSGVVSRAQLRAAYAVAEAEITGKRWAIGESFSMADCAAAPALFYAKRVEPFGDACPELQGYFARLCARPSYARVLEEAAPYLAMFPG